MITVLPLETSVTFAFCSAGLVLDRAANTLIEIA
jgi:hypothetical protein